MAQRQPELHTIERVSTPWVEYGRPVTLEMVVVRPPHAAPPFPTVVFHHGSTGSGSDPRLFTQTWTSPAVARHFTARGWQVLFPQRRGRGTSDGLYDEGFDADRSRYSCRAERSLPGLQRALADLDAVTAHICGRPDVDLRRLLVGGQSRGGVLAVVHAGHRPELFRGVLNFVGGWLGERCQDAARVNPALFGRGAAFPRPMLWLYGDGDPYYGLPHSRANFAAFQAAGGQGAFEAFTPPAGMNGHMVHAAPALWQGALDAYLEPIGR